MEAETLNHQSLRIAPRYVFHYYGDNVCLFDRKQELDQIKVNSVEGDILLAVNALNDIELAWDKIRCDYQIPSDEIEAKNLFWATINKCLQHGILIQGKGQVEIFGERGKYYPFAITVELTNFCNFGCTHCYKDANCKNNTFINLSTLEGFLNGIAGKVYSIEFTGGEATLHPEFERIVEQTNCEVLTLLTNGSNLHKISPGTLNKFDYIQVSLYGINDAEYKKFARSTHFSDVCQNIRNLCSNGMDVTVAIILRPDNIFRMDQYVDLVQSLGVKHIRFGITVKMGRNDEPNSEWLLGYDDLISFDRIYKDLVAAYPSIKFGDFDVREFTDAAVGHEKAPNVDQCQIKCFAGSYLVAVSESGYVRPCVFMPTQFFNAMSCTEYLNLIRNGESIDYSNCIKNCARSYAEKGKSLSEICNKAFG